MGHMNQTGYQRQQAMLVYTSDIFSATRTWWQNVKTWPSRFAQSCKDRF